MSRFGVDASSDFVSNYLNQVASTDASLVPDLPAHQQIPIVDVFVK